MKKHYMLTCLSEGKRFNIFIDEPVGLWLARKNHPTLIVLNVFEVSKEEFDAVRKLTSGNGKCY